MVAPIFHWYVGVPPLVGVAVKVTLVPAQMVPAGTAAMLTLAVNEELTVMVTGLEIAGLPEGQVALEIISQVTISPWAKVELVNVGLFEPRAPPFTFHW